MKITLLQADVTMFGAPRSINWEEGEKVFAIFGVQNFEEARSIMSALGIKCDSSLLQQPVEVDSQVDDPAVREDVRMAEAETQSAATRGQIPLATPITRSHDAIREAPHFDLPATGAVPKDVAVFAAVESSRPMVEQRLAEEKASPKEAAPASGASTKPQEAAASTATDDFGAFANMSTFAQAVAEIRKRGNETYESILAYCLKLQGIGDVCPPIDQLGTGKGPAADKARLEDRLKTHLTGKGIKIPE